MRLALAILVGLVLGFVGLVAGAYIGGDAETRSITDGFWGLLLGLALGISGTLWLGSKASLSIAGPVPGGFKYLLLTPNGEPYDPTRVFVTAFSFWRPGEEFVLDGSQFRIIAIDLDISKERREQLDAQRVDGTWVIEPVEGMRDTLS